MALVESVLPASYLGVPFLAEGISTPGGLKHVKHVYPNSPNQVIEKLGKKQRPYQVRALITGDDDYARRRDLLLQALESGTTGVFVHPFHGALANYVAVDYNLDEDFASLGEARFTILFEQDSGLSVPQISTADLTSLINTQTESVISETRVVFTDRFSIAGIGSTDVLDAIQKGRDVATAIEDASDIFTQATLQINQFSDELSSFSADIVNLVQTPIDFYNSFDGLITSFNGIFTSAEASFDALKELFVFGDDDGTDDLPTNTQSYIDRINNRRQLNSAVQIIALSNAYQVASLIPFETVSQQDEILQELEGQFQVTYDDPNIDPSIKLLIQDLRDTSQDNFDNQRNPPEDSVSNVDTVPLRRLTPIHTFETSGRLLSFQYFGDSSAGESIVRLNNKHDASFISGDLEIFTS